MASSRKPEAHNVLHRRQWRTEPRPQVTCTWKFHEVGACGFWDMRADRQTYRHSGRNASCARTGDVVTCSFRSTETLSDGCSDVSAAATETWNYGRRQSAKWARWSVLLGSPRTDRQICCGKPTKKRRQIGSIVTPIARSICRPTTVNTRRRSPRFGLSTGRMY